MASAASSATFCPLAATRCVSDAVRKSSCMAVGSAWPSPSTMPRSSPLTGPDASARSARARTPSTNPAKPPRLPSVARTDDADRAAWTLRVRIHAWAGESGLSVPDTASCAPIGAVSRGIQRPAVSATRSPRSCTVACQPPKEVSRGRSSSTSRSVTERPVSGRSAERSSCSTRAWAASAPAKAVASSASASHGRRGAASATNSSAAGCPAASIPATNAPSAA